MTYRIEPIKILKTHSLAQASVWTTEQIKQCRKCQVTKPTSEFYRETKGSRGRQGQFRAVCKSCWLGHEPEVTDDDLKEFIQNFVLNHLAEHGSTASLFFQHWLEHRYPKEISKQGVERAINGLVRSCKIVSEDRVITGERVSVLRLPSGIRLEAPQRSSAIEYTFQATERLPADTSALHCGESEKQKPRGVSEFSTGLGLR
jgi:hypothetical protein